MNITCCSSCNDSGHTSCSKTHTGCISRLELHNNLIIFIRITEVCGTVVVVACMCASKIWDAMKSILKFQFLQCNGVFNHPTFLFLLQWANKYKFKFGSMPMQITLKSCNKNTRHVERRQHMDPNITAKIGDAIENKHKIYKWICFDHVPIVFPFLL